MAIALDESPELKHTDRTASDLSLRKLDEEKAPDVIESEVVSDDESEVNSAVIQKAEDVAVKVR